MSLKYYDEVPPLKSLAGFRNQEVIRVWKLKRDSSSRFCLTREGKIYIVGDTEIVSKMTDAELLEGMLLGSNIESTILYTVQMCIDAFEQAGVNITLLPFYRLRQVYDEWLMLVTISAEPVSAAKYLIAKRPF